MPQAIPGASVSTAPIPFRGGSASNTGAVGTGQGLLRVVSGEQLNELDRQKNQTRASSQRAKAAAQAPPDLGSYIRQRWMVLRNHRNTGDNPLNERLLRTQRMFEGKYDPEKLAQIRQFGGSEVYARVVAGKCRGATALLRDVYMGPDRPWDIQSQPDPPVPPEIAAAVVQLVQTETQTLAQAGQPVMEDKVRDRLKDLMHAAQAAARRNAEAQAAAASDAIDDILVAGNFYKSIAEFITDLPLFPFACLKGPVVRMVPRLKWVNGRPSLKNTACMFWERVNPFDIYWTPGASRIEDAEIIERKRLTRTDLNDLLGLPGYDEAAVRAALNDYASGLREWMDTPDCERALNEGRENPEMNLSHYIDCVEYHGNVQGHVLLDEGVDEKLIPDLDRDYAVQSWVCGRHTLKTQLNPSPRQRHPYFITSYEKVPGTIAGHAIPEIIEDIQECANAFLRASVNNSSISSGPQVVINDEMIAPNESGDELYPWKRWHTTGDPLGNQREPITFFQPSSNLQEMLGGYTQMTTLADENSGIPKYITGSDRIGGAGRTASGLSMLMGNAAKALQTVAGNIDQDVMTPLLQGLYDLVMMTDTSGLLTGEEEIKVLGVDVAVQKETENQKRLQFLQITANPIDGPIIGELGRARVLRAIAQGLGLPDDIVPDDTTLQQQIAQAKQQAEQAQQAQLAMAMAGVHPGQHSGQHSGGHAGGPAGGAPKPTAQPGAQAGSPGAGSPGAMAAGNQPPHPGPGGLAQNAAPINLMAQGLNNHV